MRASVCSNQEFLQTNIYEKKMKVSEFKKILAGLDDDTEIVVDKGSNIYDYEVLIHEVYFDADKTDVALIVHIKTKSIELP